MDAREEVTVDEGLPRREMSLQGRKDSDWDWDWDWETGAVVPCL